MAPRPSSNKARQVPQELIDQFIDHLHDDRKTLKACCMVSRSWKPSSQFHLFCAISVTDSSDSFAAFLRAYPHIAAYIRHLRFYPAPKNGRITTIICPLHALPVILNRLPQLKSLELDSMCAVCLCESPTACQPAPVSLKTLCLRSVADYDHDAKEGVLQLFSVFSTVQLLHVIQNMGISTRRSLQPNTFTCAIPHLKVEHIKFDCSNIDYICSGLLISPSIHSLGTIDVNIHNIADVNSLTNLLDGAAQSLRDITLNISPAVHRNLTAQEQQSEYNPCL